MNVWGIADLHLSFARPDAREKIAGRWRDAAARIEAGWREVVRSEDVVLIPGDISMARNHRDLQPDLAWLDRLPGTKVLSRGNHDRWWNRMEAVRPLLRRSERAVAGDAVDLGAIVACGTMGAAPVDDNSPTDARDGLQKELAKLDAALAAAQAIRDGRPLYVLWHYPPFDATGRPGPVVERLEPAGVTACVYGHLHAESQWGRAVQGLFGSVRYHLVAADAIGFRPLRIGP